MKRLLGILFVVISSIASAQNTTVTGTVTDPDGFAWAGGSVQFTLYNSAGGIVKQGGVPLTPAQMNKTVALDNTGSFSLALADNTTLSPVGTQWTLLVCPAASAPCQTLAKFTASGSTLNLTSAIASQLQALRFPAGYTARGYGDIEISPLPPPGGTYYNLQSTVIRFWNGTIWAALAGGGGAGNPNAPANSVQIANSSVTGFNSDPGFLIDPAAHTFTSTKNMILNAISIVPRNTYDPMDTRFNGGLAAAIAGTSGFSPTQVIQAAIDYGECQLQTHAVTNGGINIPLPAANMQISQLLLWSGTSIGGDQNAVYAIGPILQHTDATKSMLVGHGSSDTLVCGGTTYTPGAAGGMFLHNFAISGMGSTTASNRDIGIELNGSFSAIWQVWGSGNQFGSQAIYNDGFNNFIFFAGYYGAQLSGCGSYTTGTLPISSSVTPNQCNTVQDSSVDSEMHYIYATDAAEQLSGHGPGACYPGCAAIGTGNNTDASHLFAQISDVDISIQGTAARVTAIRADGTSREMILLGGQNNIVDDIQMNGSCLSSALQPNYNTGTQTGCYAIKDAGQGNIVSNWSGGGGNTFFGQAYMECGIWSGTVGFAAVGGLYTQGVNRGNPNNGGANDEAFCGTFQGDSASGKVIFSDAMAEQTANGSTIDVSNLTSIFVNTTTPVTVIKGAVAGQTVTFRGVPGASIVPGGTSSQNITTCTGLPEILSNVSVRTFTNKGGYRGGGTTPNNQWNEICNTPQLTPLHVAYAGNPTPSQPSMVDFFGNIQARQLQNAGIDVSQLHGPVAPTGQYCFMQKNTFSDGYYTTSPLACTTVDLTHQTAGEVFVFGANYVSSYDLYLVSNSTGSSIPLGKYPPPAGSNPLFWDGPTTIAAGGDGSTPPPASINYTGMYIAPWGVLLNTYNNTQPPCDITTRGRMWLISGGGTNPDVYQGCIQTGVSTYAWSNLALGSVGTTGFVTLNTGPGSLGNSHISEASNVGYDTFTQGIIVNDSSGNGGNSIATEGTKPVGPPALCVSGTDCMWADSTAHNWMMDNGGTGSVNVVGISTAGTPGNCPKLDTNGKNIVDSGAPCGSGTPPGTPTYVMDAGAGTGPTGTSLSSGSTDYSGFINFTTGTCTGGVCPSAVGVVSLLFSRTYSPQLKCSAQPSNANAVGLANNVQPYIPFANLSGVHFVLQSNTTGLPQSTALAYYYHCDPQ